MGVDLTVLDFLFKFKGKIKGGTLQLGRQGFHIPRDPAHEQRPVADEILRKYDPDARFGDITDETGSANKLFGYLGSTTVVAMDSSAYEGAEIIHDLNSPVPDHLHACFDTIFDGGTIEHIFNAPMAFDNVKAMLKPDGLFLSVNGANNHLGHGFYQFSPELMWRVFSKDAGFQVELMQLVVIGGMPQPVDAPDPAVVGQRIEIGSTDGPTYILLAARKVEARTTRHVPQQSDYVSRWYPGGEQPPAAPADHRETNHNVRSARALDGLVNVAARGTASQSSLSPWSQDGEAGRAIAGSWATDFAFHTQHEHRPWWEVDLNGAFPIEAIVVHNRRSAGRDRARTLTIEIAENAGEWILVHAGYANFGARDSGHPFEIWVGSELRARYVRLSIRENQFFHLLRVEVFARADLVALETYSRQHGFQHFNQLSTDFGRPYTLEKATGAVPDVIIGLKINVSGRFGNLALQYTNAIEIARKTGLRYIQLGHNELLDARQPFTVDGLTFLPAEAALPPDGLFIAGVFFNSDVFAPLLSPFLRFGPQEERLHSFVARTYLRPHLLSGIPLPGEIHHDDEVTIHIRSGDIFENDKPVETMYRQPPLSFYTLVIERLRAQGLITRVRLVFEDRGNPCIEPLETWLATHAIPTRVQCGTLHQDMSALIDAPHLVFGFGTFGYAACRLSKRIETLHYFAPEFGGKYGFIPGIAKVYAVWDREGRYIKGAEWGQRVHDEWHNTAEQRALMVSYPADWLEVEELPRDDRTSG